MLHLKGVNGHPTGLAPPHQPEASEPDFLLHQPYIPHAVEQGLPAIPPCHHLQPHVQRAVHHTHPSPHRLTPSSHTTQKCLDLNRLPTQN